MEIEHQIRNRYIKSITEDVEKRKELKVLYLEEMPSLQFESQTTGKKMLWYLDSKKCTGCKQCVMACSLAKTGKYNPTDSRVYVKRIESKGWSVPMLCEHCVEAPCAKICPVYAISRDEETGIVAIDLEKCIGCRLCRYECPWGKETISIREIEGYKGLKAIKCDLCGGDPACAKVCIPGVIRWVEWDENSSNLKKEYSKIRAQDIVAMDVEGCY